MKLFTDAEVAKALRDMGAPRSLTVTQARFIAKLLSSAQPKKSDRPAQVDPDIVLISPLPEAGEYERGYNKAVEIMGQRLADGYGIADPSGATNNGTPARRSAAR